MNRKSIIEQMTEVNKLTFNNAFDAIALLQDQSGKLVNALLDQTDLLPSESRKFADAWAEAYKMGRLNLKKLIDSGFKQIEEQFPSKAGHDDTKS
jgi:hypothetical protein